MTSRSQPRAGIRARRARTLLRWALILAIPSFLAGCANVPLVGDLAARLEPLLPGFIRDRLGLSSADTSTSQPTSASFGHGHRPAQQDQSATAVASADATQDVQALYDHYVSVNTDFDHLRTLGLEDLYAGRTADAITAFHQALALRPGDTNVTALLNLAEHPGDSSGAGFGSPTGNAGGYSDGSSAGMSAGGSGGSVAQSSGGSWNSAPAVLPQAAPANFGMGSGGGSLPPPLPRVDPGALSLPASVHLQPVPAVAPAQPTSAFHPIHVSPFAVRR